MDVFPVAALGYRFFRLRDGQLYPWHLLLAPAWDSAVQEAVCHQHSEHSAPVSACECGLYAYHHLDALVDLRYRKDALVRGVIAGSGRVEVHEDGFRAERMQLLHLYDDTSEIKEAARVYGVSHGTHPQLDKSVRSVATSALPM